ncbi:pre-peptidase C-terminal domain-containing protein [Paenacidovorax caeni]|uniref:Pre-peptidase C-terminal domain-containing protein n=1 Tax=Paenacidovorax caeni TaxID=343013 RepID=A0A1I7JZP8_9BURK|nr:pre-peptidase C-terminal domain-containing protein [Paenacidovorax caeni]
MQCIQNIRKCLLRPLQAAIIAGAAFTGSQALSAERIILGNPQAAPLSATRDSNITATLSALKSEAKESGTVRVIVGIRVPFAPEGKLEQAEQAAQRSEIAAAQRTVLSKLPLLAESNRQPKPFSTIPFMGLEVTEAELDELTKMTEVISIEEDRAAKATLAQSVPLVGLSGGSFNGYSGNGQTVAILDTGVDKNHPDLAGRVVSEACYSTSNATSQSICPGGGNESTAANSAMPYASGVCAPSECDHGTHVAGIAAGAQGVARGANIIAIQVFSAFPSTHPSCGGSACALTWTSDQIRGLERVNALRASYNIASVNMSLGGGRYSANCDAANSSQKAIIDTLRSNGIATVISSGNDGYTDSMGAPGCISSAVSVGATWDAAGYTLGSCSSAPPSAIDSVACYSNSASFLNLLAPGSLIYAPIPYGGYGNWNGTSMAAPHVAGAWAVLKQKSPASSVDSVLSALTSTGTPVVDYRNGISKPRINVAAAVNVLGGGTFYTLSVAKSGTGTGTVTSSPSGINCGSDCSESYPAGTSVTLTATPSAGHTFTGWSGACAGSATSCSVAMNAAKSVTATFAYTPQAALSVANVGNGTGTVARTGGTLYCGSLCNESLAVGSIVTLTATPASDSIFVGWSGGSCTGTGTCVFTINANTTVTAVFQKSGSARSVTPLLQTNLSGTQYSMQNFSVSVPYGAKNLLIQISGGTGDADLYVRYGAAPTLAEYDCRPLLGGNNESCSIPVPQAGVYYISIYGYSSYSGTTLSVSHEKSMPSIIPILNLLFD